MKSKMLGVFFVFGLMLLSPVLAHAQQSTAAPVNTIGKVTPPAAPTAPTHPDWYACENDSDCARDPNSCGGMISVNQALLQDYHDANAKNVAGAECPDLPRAAHMILDAMQPKCEAKHCVTTMAGQPSNRDLDVQWFKCNTDADCFYDAGACGGPVSLNEQYREQYHQAQLKRTAPGQCAPTPLPKDLTPGRNTKQATAMCRNQTCTTIVSASAPDNGKPDSRWISCDTDEDCTKTEAVCGAMMPLNKKYQDKFDKMIVPARSKVSFACYFIPDNAKTMTQQMNSVCRFNMCTLEK